MLRQLRMAAGIVFFALLSLFFLDFTEVVPLELAWLAKIQFFPAMMGALAGIAASLTILAILVITTLLFGRIYCSVVCPLGILQDIVGRMARFRNRKKKRHVYRPSFKKTRFVFFFIAVISILAGLAGCLVGASLLGFLDPYACYGRIVTGIVSPLYTMGNNLIATVARGRGSYYFYLVDASVKSSFTLGVAMISLFLVGFLAWRWGRLYCNAVCPVGTFLGFLAKFSLFKIRIDAGECVGCKLCEGVCKGGCLDAANKKIDADRCVVCFDCLSVCRKGAIHYVPTMKKRFPIVEIGHETSVGIGGKKNESNVESNIKLNGKSDVKSGVKSGGKPSGESSAAKSTAMIDSSKRRFLEGIVTTFAAAGVSAYFAKRVFAESAKKDASTGESASNGTLGNAPPEGNESSAPLKISDKGKKPYKIEHAVTPPGAVGLRHLAAHCTGCHLCVAQCPTNVIKPAFLDYGLGGIMLPVMKFSAEVFCNFDCARCGEVCPAGAIRPLSTEEKHATQIGRVVFIKENCIVFTEETNCGACAEHCPTQAVRMIDYKGNLTIPETLEQYCVGCGACESICPVIPFKAIYVEGNPIHRTAEKPPQAEKIDIKLDDFGF